MKMFAIGAACAALALCTAAVAQPAYAPRDDLARFDARATPDLAAKLAICDTARFLRTSPDLDSNVIYVYRQNQGRYDPLLPPYFVGGPQWYDEDLERAYRRLRGQGQVNFDQVQAARYAIGRDMVKAFDRVSGPERRFLDEQSRYCEAVEDAGKA